MNDQLEKAKDSALRSLARREHSIWDLSQKLLAKGFDKPIVEETIKSMLEQNFLNELRFVEAWIYHRTQKRYGPVKIRAELQMQNIDESMFADQLNENDEYWVENAIQQRQKKFGRLTQDVKLQAKQKRYLYQRGFTASQINRALQAAQEIELKGGH